MKTPSVSNNYLTRKFDSIQFLISGKVPEEINKLESIINTQTMGNYSPNMKLRSSKKLDKEK